MVWVDCKKLKIGAFVIAEKIKKFGWYFQEVYGDTESGEQPFYYSIGFEKTLGQPELLMFGLPKKAAHSIMSHCFNLMKDGETLETEKPLSRVIKDPFNVWLKPIRKDCFDEYLGIAVDYYGNDNFRANLVFFPDKQHLFPWEEGHVGISQQEALELV
ncbi:hypothetical protein BTA51_06605 [Hahella sp. CCB-MM4]|uniref:DUF4262 domain-containing protein n=1 Tax=Hahella sp. (strain CCB-MM4) TaxID=1926491 RepID=UPI000B9AEF35|nr:DUF4262 domain-containing protein [Hahella sp. CCB-MM4]OZG74652.1 hypothetical protein BTA51_06605 [Hahella sp. CCB-MM4]